eukprot:1444594-Amphidinium_carterae.1
MHEQHMSVTPIKQHHQKTLPNRPMDVGAHGTAKCNRCSTIEHVGVGAAKYMQCTVHAITVSALSTRMLSASANFHHANKLGS